MSSDHNKKTNDYRKETTLIINNAILENDKIFMNKTFIDLKNIMTQLDPQYQYILFDIIMHGLPTLTDNYRFYLINEFLNNYNVKTDHKKFNILADADAFFRIFELPFLLGAGQYNYIVTEISNLLKRLIIEFDIKLKITDWIVMDSDDACGKKESEIYSDNLISLDDYMMRMALQFGCKKSLAHCFVYYVRTLILDRDKNMVFHFDEEDWESYDAQTPLETKMDDILNDLQSKVNELKIKDQEIKQLESALSELKNDKATEYTPKRKTRFPSE